MQSKLKKDKISCRKELNLRKQNEEKGQLNDKLLSQIKGTLNIKILKF